MLRSLRSHSVNTLTDLRRIEKLLVPNGRTSTDVTEALNTAWVHYVNSNNLLAELRGLTRDYPFPSALLTEAKCDVISDPTSIKSWNMAWLVLKKMKDEYVVMFQPVYHPKHSGTKGIDAAIECDILTYRRSLISKHARDEARKPIMWGGHNFNAKDVDKLAKVFLSSWTRAVDQMLKQWSMPPKYR